MLRDEKIWREKNQIFPARGISGVPTLVLFICHWLIFYLRCDGCSLKVPLELETRKAMSVFIWNS